MNTERAHEIIDLLAGIEAQIAESHIASQEAFESNDGEAIKAAWEAGRSLVHEKNDLRNELMGILH